MFSNWGTGPQFMKKKMMVNVTIYSIHGSYGFLFNTFGSCESPWSLELLTVLLEVVMSTKCTCERTWKNKGTHVIKFTCSTLSKICKKNIAPFGNVCSSIECNGIKENSPWTCYSSANHILLMIPQFHIKVEIPFFPTFCHFERQCFYTQLLQFAA